MRLNHHALPAVAALAAMTLAPLPAAAADQAAPPDANTADLLGNMVVMAGAGRPLPKIAVAPSLASDMEDVTLRSVVRRDLDLSGEFELLDDEKAPESAWDNYQPDAAVDLKAWSGRGLEAVVKVSGRPVNAADAELRAQVYLVARPPNPVYEARIVVAAADVRAHAHRLADLVIGALTGQNGGFSSRMTFASGTGKLRRAYVIDADGGNPHALSPSNGIAIAPAFGRNEDLYYALSVGGDEYKIVSASSGPVDSSVKGSVYGIAFSKDRSQVAISVGVGPTIRVFAGSDFTSLAPASDVAMALHPAFTPSGKLAFAGAGSSGQRIYVDNKPISPDGLFASAPTFCNHPDGVRAVFAVGVGKDTDLVSTGETGGPLVRLTQGQGRNGYPACSPDGRLVAFFSTRASGEGPGLYIMREGGGRPKRISPMLGDSLRWDPRPPPPEKAAPQMPTPQKP
ncbi:MAG: PD40 domain-containing protein [Polyangiaceae bacterium]|nr:PD40 domain-containing protein [Polyangiaceae bacterium]